MIIKPEITVAKKTDKISAKGYEGERVQVTSPKGKRSAVLKQNIQQYLKKGYKLVKTT